MTEAVVHAEYPPLVLRIRPAIEMNEDEFFEFCRVNWDLRIERTAEGDLEIMTPAGGKTSSGNSEINILLVPSVRRTPARLWALPCRRTARILPSV